VFMEDDGFVLVSRRGKGKGTLGPSRAGTRRGGHTGGGRGGPTGGGGHSEVISGVGSVQAAAPVDAATVEALVGRVQGCRRAVAESTLCQGQLSDGAPHPVLLVLPALDPSTDLSSFVAPEW
jgi:hypothetical protein